MRFPNLFRQQDDQTNQRRASGRCPWEKGEKGANQAIRDAPTLDKIDKGTSLGQQPQKPHFVFLKKLSKRFSDKKLRSQVGRFQIKSLFLQSFFKKAQSAH